MSPTTIPRTAPRGFWRAVNLPILMVALILGNVRACTTFLPSETDGDCLARCPTVVSNDRPSFPTVGPLPPFLDERRFDANFFSSREKLRSDTNSVIAAGRGSLITGGRRTGSCNWFKTTLVLPFAPNHLHDVSESFCIVPLMRLRRTVRQISTNASTCPL